MDILFFNRSFYPDPEATGQFLTELCEDLAKEGHNITVVAGKSYHVDDDKNISLIQHEQYKSINIIRVHGTKFSKRLLFFRLVNLTTYFLLAFIGGFLIKRKPDIVVVQTDPPVSGLLGIFFSKWYKRKFIYSCNDIYPDVGIITKRFTNPLLNFLLEKINLISFRMADRVICLGEDMKRRIVTRSIKEDKITVIHDWADTKNLYPVHENENPFRAKNNLDNYFTVMYSGNIGLTQGLEKFIEVAEFFRNKDNIKFILIGEGADKINLQNQVSKAGLLNVDFLPYQPKEELKFSLSAPDIHLITIQKGLAGIIVPSKVYGILSCGKPFVAWVDKVSEVSIIARKFRCGITVPPGDVRNMIRVIEWAAKHHGKLAEMGNNGRMAAIKFFDREVSVNKFKETFIKTISQ